MRVALIKDRYGKDYPVVLRYSLKSFIKDLRDGALPGEVFTEKGRYLEEGCMGRIQHYSMLNCAMNPKACKEKDNALTPRLNKKKVLMVGGGLVGCELALHLAKKGKNVTIVEALNKILALNGPLCSANSEMLERLIPFNNITVKTNSKVKTYKDGLLEMETENWIEKIKCDSVILSVGYKEENSLYKELEFEVPEIYLLGDARKVSNIMYGIWDAYEVANHL